MTIRCSKVGSASVESASPTSAWRLAVERPGPSDRRASHGFGQRPRYGQGRVQDGLDRVESEDAAGTTRRGLQGDEYSRRRLGPPGPRFKRTTTYQPNMSWLVRRRLITEALKIPQPPLLYGLSHYTMLARGLMFRNVKSGERIHDPRHRGAQIKPPSVALVERPPKADCADDDDN